MRQKRIDLLKFENAKNWDISVKSPIVKWAIVLICIGADIATFYTSFSPNIDNNPQIVWVLVIISAVIIDTLPVLLAFFWPSSWKDAGTGQKAVCWLILIALFLVVALTFFIRFTGSAELFGEDSTSEPNVSVPQPDLEDVSWFPGEPSYIGITLLLAILPILTSILCYAVCYDPEPEKTKNNKRARRIRQQQIQLNQEINEIETAIEAYEKELAEHNLKGHDEEKYHAALWENGIIAACCKIIARRCLAEKLKSPSATTYLMEENRLKEIIKGGENPILPPMNGLVPAPEESLTPVSEENPS